MFGAGGGLVVVPMLSAIPLEPKKAHATSIAVILPLSILSIALTIKSGVSIDWMLVLCLIVSGLVGAFAGSALLPKIKGVWLTRIFGFIMVFSAVRILLR